MSQNRNTFPGITHATALLRKQLQFEEWAEYYRTELQAYLEEDDERMQAWEAFRRQGGVTPQDLYHWRCGNPMPSAVKKKQHLRLVPSEGGEAA